ncbi:hypothetical protein IGI04_003750 [Brassica rapa subsp. trilocularis]|uniref:MATH domain-containing protein n=1 Tax=Brassica rapa subsp. trilocularis TaxID=1813537 RepID=A0ABQ7NZC7_BRACM|nr:hypothetical protein IGI04_003750 [Brassica rapa subsp. trilocularis]
MVPLTNWEVVSITQEYSKTKFCWTLKEFSELKEHCYVSSKILVGGRNWVLKLYPKGLNATYIPHADDETVKTGEETYEQCEMRILDPFGCDHLTRTINQKLSNSTPNLGWHKLVLLANLEKVYLDKLDGVGVERPVLHNRARGVVVLVQHRSPAPEQVPAEQLRVQVPDLPHHVPHDPVLAPQLPRHRVDEDGPYADATAARALKSVLQGILLSSEGEKLNSMNLLLYMAPIAVVFLLPATLIMEKNVVGITSALARDDVLGNAKGAVAVVVSILIFKNPVSMTGMLGYSLTVCGVILYSEAKKRSK